MMPVISWTALKSFADTRNLLVQWVEDENFYFLAAIDGSLQLECTLNKNNRNNDLQDFEDNYKTLGANARNKINVNNITGTITLPAGASTESTQASIDAKIPTLGQKTSANSTPVVLSSDQSPIPTASKVALTPSSPASATVGIASASAVSANASRKGLVIVNLSINRISLGFGSTAVLNSGITLYPGGVFIMDEYTFNTSPVNTISSAASSPISIQEFT